MDPDPKHQRDLLREVAPSGTRPAERVTHASVTVREMAAVRRAPPAPLVRAAREVPAALGHDPRAEDPAEQHDVARARRELPTYSDEDDCATETGRATSIAPSARDRPVLLRLDGAQAGQVVLVPPAGLIIGRHAESQLVIDDAGVSRKHARIVKQGGETWVEDLGSANGTYVQGQRVQRARLNHDDWVQVGLRVTFRFAVTDAHEERVLRQMYESSTRDALTGAHNRRHFDDRLGSEIAFAVRHRVDLAIVMFDLDHFKQVNDRYGHPAGDAVLRHVVGLVNARLRTEDFLARVGGEEFAVVLRGTNVLGAARLAERLRVSVAAAGVNHDAVLVPASISLGCAALSEVDQRSACELIALADRRLYLAKGAGRNRVVSAD